MHNLIGIITCEKLFLNYDQSLIHFPHEKRYFLQLYLSVVTLHKIEQPLHPPFEIQPASPTIFGGLVNTYLIHQLRNVKCVFLVRYFSRQYLFTTNS